MGTTLPVVVASEGKVFQFPTPENASSFELEARQAGSETMRLEPALPAAARPLYDLESHLACLLDVDEQLPEDLEREYELELQATLAAVVEKRDRVGQFRQHLKAQVALAHEEKMRLDAREAFYQRALDRMDSYITRIIETLGYDAKGKRKKLEGKTLTIGLHGCDKSTLITDEQAVPAKYKRVTVTLPAETWEELCDSVSFELRDKLLDEVKSPKVEVSLSAVKTDLKDGADIPGAKLTGGTYVEVK